MQHAMQHSVRLHAYYQCLRGMQGGLVHHGQHTQLNRNCESLQIVPGDVPTPCKRTRCTQDDLEAETWPRDVPMTEAEHAVRMLYRRVVRRLLPQNGEWAGAEFWVQVGALT